MAVLAITAAHLFWRRDHTSPDGRGRALWNGFPLERGNTRRLAGIDRGDQTVSHRRRHVAAKLGLDSPGMHGGGANSALLVPAVELDGEQHVGRLRAPICAELRVGGALKVRIVEIDVGEAVEC